MADVAVVRPVLVGLVTLVATCCWTAATAWVTGRSPTASEVEPVDPPSAGEVQAITVRIHAVGCGWRSTGSGALIGDDLVASNRHVVAGTASVDVSGVSPSGTWSSPATLVGAAPDQDLVLLRLAWPPAAAPVELAPEGLRMQEPVAFGGFPDGQRLDVRDAVASSRWSQPAPSAAGPVWVLSEPGAAGMSGGPVLNGSGDLAGVVFAFEERSRTTLALGSDLIAELVAETGASTAPVVVAC